MKTKGKTTGVALRITDVGVLQYLNSANIWVNILYEPVGTSASLLTTDELAAINGAASPSATNVFMTVDDAEVTQTSVIAATTIDWSASNHFTKTLSGDVELTDANLPINPIVKNISLTITPDGNGLTLPSYWRVTDGTYDNSVDNYITVFCEDDTSQAKVDTVTLTGTSGTATMGAAGGLTKTVTFALAGTTDLTQTASDFVTSFTADYLAEKIIITSSGEDIIFTSQYAGYDFTSPTITAATGDLDGTVANTTANISPIVWASIKKEA